MDIYLKNKNNSKSSFQFPSLPESIKVKGNANYQEYDIIRKGTVAFPSGLELQTVQWQGMFWGESRKNVSQLMRKWVAPETCIKKLESWKEKGTVLNLIVSDGGINKDVTIKSFEYEQSGGRGDYEYSITFVVYKSLEIYTVDELGLEKSAEKKTKSSRSKAEKKKQYKVVSGDSLWKIAKKFYGSGSDWKKIYNANKSVIESTAKKHGYKSSNNGWWIFPGCILTIP